MPEIGDIQPAYKIGKSGRANNIYVKCPSCGYTRWTKLNAARKLNYIVYCKKNKCQQQHYTEMRRSSNPLYWNGISELKVGMVVAGRSIGYATRGLLIRDQCPKCYTQMWRYKKDIGRLCVNCDNSDRKKYYSGKGNPAWLGGLSYEPYTNHFSDDMKEFIRIRDNYTCQLCGKHQSDEFRKMSIHHIDYIKEHSYPSNLITLCTACNSHVDANRKYWVQHFNYILNMEQIDKHYKVEFMSKEQIAYINKNGGIC